LFAGGLYKNYKNLRKVAHTFVVLSDQVVCSLVLVKIAGEVVAHSGSGVVSCTCNWAYLTASQGLK